MIAFFVSSITLWQFRPEQSNNKCGLIPVETFISGKLCKSFICSFVLFLILSFQQWFSTDFKTKSLIWRGQSANLLFSHTANSIFVPFSYVQIDPHHLVSTFLGVFLGFFFCGMLTQKFKSFLPGQTCRHFWLYTLKIIIFLFLLWRPFGSPGILVNTFSPWQNQQFSLPKDCRQQDFLRPVWEMGQIPPCTSHRCKNRNRFFRAGNILIESFKYGVDQERMHSWNQNTMSNLLCIEPMIS